jgi:hypothetical protein
MKIFGAQASKRMTLFGAKTVDILLNKKKLFCCGTFFGVLTSKRMKLFGVKTFLSVTLMAQN